MSQSSGRFAVVRLLCLVTCIAAPEFVGGCDGAAVDAQPDPTAALPSTIRSAPQSGTPMVQIASDPLAPLVLEKGERLRFQNPLRGLAATFEHDGAVAVTLSGGTGPLRTRPDDRTALLRLRTVAWGRSDAVIELHAMSRVTPRPGACDGLRRTRAGQCLERAELVREGAPLEWWKNDERGLEQGWTFAEAPSGAGFLSVAVAAEGWSIEVDADAAGATFVNGAERVRYAELRAWDADGVELASWMQAEDGVLRVAVDDAGARYPVSIDPLITAAAWYQHPGLANARYGFGASAGDLNGDGFGDVVVGAPGFSNGQAGEGRVFVYYGSVNGLRTDTAWTVESDQIGANLGQDSRSAGDVNGDGYGDLVVGAQYYDQPGGGVDHGRLLIYLGAATGLDATRVWTIEGDQSEGCRSSTDVA